MLGRSHFYNKTIRKVVVVFGTLFNDLYLKRYTKSGTEYERLKVPLAYGPKEKFITRLQSDPSLTKSINTSVPRMSFDLTGLSYDSSRKRITTQRTFTQTSDDSGVSSMYSPVPYTFNFSLSIYVRNIEDGTQLIEQIVPFFTPDFTVTVDFVPAIGHKFDIPIILDSIDQNIDYEGNFDDTRLITWTLNFTVKGYLYPEVSPVGIIKSANTNFWMETEKQDIQKIRVDTSPTSSNGTFTLNETLYIDNKDITGKLIYKSQITIGSNMTVSELSEWLEVGDTVRGLTSNATSTVEQVFAEPYINALRIETKPDPLTAEKSDYFTYDETIFEWPETLTP